jgi:hypothetical protein
MLRIAEFKPIATAAGALYQPRVYADRNSALWDGYIVFFPMTVGPVISTPRETTQSDLVSLQTWASGLDRIYLEGALARALEASNGVVLPTSFTDLVVAETAAAADAIALHRAADRAGADATSELKAAETHEQAAAVAREGAARLTRQQREFERLANESERSTAEVAAEAYESAAREARTVAADIGRAESATDKPRRKRPAPRKKR